MANTTNYEVRHEDFGDGLETWAIYQTTKNANTGISVSTHVRDAKTEEAALDMVDALLSEKSGEMDVLGHLIEVGPGGQLREGGCSAATFEAPCDQRSSRAS